MLYRNNEPFSLTTEQFEQFAKAMIFKLPKGAYSWNVLNQMLDVRNSQAIPTSYVVNEELIVSGKKNMKGRNTIRYADSVRPMEDNPKLMIYEPLYLEIRNTGFMATSAEEVEKNYFLFNSPHNESNPLRPKEGRIKIFYEVHEPQKIASVKIAKLTLQARAQALLLDESVKMTDAELLPIAFNYFYSEANHGFLASPEHMDPESIRVKLYNLTLTNPSKFLDLCKENATPIRDMIQKASAKRVIIFQPDSFDWVFNGEEGLEFMLKLQEGDGPAESLITMLEENDARGYVPRIRKRMLDLQRMVKV